MSEEKTAFAVWTNTDLTEGRGREYVKYVTEKKSTALRLAKRIYVHGTDGHVSKITLLHHNGNWYFPSNIINVVPPTEEDLKEEKRIEEEKIAKELKEKAIAKAKELGLTDEELSALRG